VGWQRLALERFLLDATSRFGRQALMRLRRIADAKEAFRLHRLFLAINHPNVEVKMWVKWSPYSVFCSVLHVLTSHLFASPSPRPTHDYTSPLLHQHPLCDACQ